MQPWRSGLVSSRSVRVLIRVQQHALTHRVCLCFGKYLKVCLWLLRIILTKWLFFYTNFFLTHPQKKALKGNKLLSHSHQTHCGGLMMKTKPIRAHKRTLTQFSLPNRACTPGWVSEIIESCGLVGYTKPMVGIRGIPLQCPQGVDIGYEPCSTVAL